MPCDSSYMEPNGKERALQKTAELLEWCYGQEGSKVPKSVSTAAQDEYCELDLVPTLCTFLKGLSSKRLAQLCNQSNAMSRRLKEWHKDHILADIEREKEEKERKTALAKLTPKERRALGL
jgi:hypothetical protein